VWIGDKQCLLTILTHLDSLNEHISAVALELGNTTTFKKIKLRICTDLGVWNALLPDVAFAYPSVADAVILLLPGAPGP
jgi:hypothetical protein